MRRERAAVRGYPAADAYLICIFPRSFSPPPPKAVLYVRWRPGLLARRFNSAPCRTLARLKSREKSPVSMSTDHGCGLSSLQSAFCLIEPLENPTVQIEGSMLGILDESWNLRKRFTLHEQLAFVPSI